MNDFGSFAAQVFDRMSFLQCLGVTVLAAVAIGSLVLLLGATVSGTIIIRAIFLLTLLLGAAHGVYGLVSAIKHVRRERSK